MAWNDVPGNAANLGADYFYKTSDGAGDVTGLTAATDYVCIPRAKLSGVSAGEANETTGSMKALNRGLVEGLFDINNAKAATDKSAKLTISRGSLVGSGSEVDRTYSYKFTLDASSLEVAAE